MNVIYLDDQFQAYAEQDAETTRMPWNDTGGFFAGKCDAFIEGHRVVPEGETWAREDGVIFTGLMISPFVNPAVLQSAQAAADDETIAVLDAAVVELTYQNVLLELGL